jgi:CspA family cold shock protein
VSDKRDRGRRPRRGRPDEADFPPEYLAEQPVVPVAAPALDATVTRFDVTRGFGFVAVSDGLPEAFLHVSVLAATGREAVSPGDRLRVKVANGPKGREVTAVVSVEAINATSQTLQGTVTWFNPDKAYGFVKPDKGDKDVFVGNRALRAAGLAKLVPGQRVEIEVIAGVKGPEARVLTIIKSVDAAP